MMDQNNLTYHLKQSHSKEELMEAVAMIADVINKAEHVVILTDILPRRGNDLDKVLKTHMALK
jgi:DNA-directed RNA polymerase subunit F